VVVVVGVEEPSAVLVHGEGGKWRWESGTRRVGCRGVVKGVLLLLLSAVVVVM